MRNTNLFYSKIILFGEYGIIFNSKALSIPYTYFHGELSFQNRYKYTNIEFSKKSNKHLKTYFDFLTKQDCCNIFMDLESFKTDLDKGLYFESGIPQGYGLGSSGALVAALYAKYAKNPILPSLKMKLDNILNLKTIFSDMESYFHGKSSGIDPLISYIQFPMLFKSKNDISTVRIPRNRHANGDAIFLLNTQQPGRTEPLVHYFLEKYKEDNFKERVNEKMIPLTNQCVDSLIEGEHDQFFDYLKELSDYQLHYLNPMIPYEYQGYWENGLKTNDYTLKLCGSGGGGFLLGFTRNYDKVKAYFKTQKEEIITVYRG
jgi:mevalonate kinase